MTNFRPDTSFPYLKIAREYGIEYWRVLQWADLLDSWPPRPEEWMMPQWRAAVRAAWEQEQNRRALNA